MVPEAAEEELEAAEDVGEALEEDMSALPPCAVLTLTANSVEF